MGKEVEMKFIKFLLISTLMSNSLLANGVPALVINELYFYEDSTWCLELECGIPELLEDSLYLKTKSDSAFFLPGLEFDSAGFLLLNNSSLVDSLYIDKNGDSIEIRDGYWGSLYAQIYFGPGEKYRAPDSGQSLCLDSYSFYAEYYLDNSPTPGSENDSLDATCTIYGYVKDTLDDPFKNLVLCLNKYWPGGGPDICKDGTYTNTEGLFELQPLAYAFPSKLEAWLGPFNIDHIILRENLNLSPDSTYDLGTLTITEYAGLAPEDETNSKFSLSQNHPNPVIGETKIAFTLPEELPTLLEVYNSQGQKVKTLAKGIIPRGKHEITFDATDLSSGVYIYKLRAGRHYSDSKKLILTK